MSSGQAQVLLSSELQKPFLFQSSFSYYNCKWECGPLPMKSVASCVAHPPSHHILFHLQCYLCLQALFTPINPPTVSRVTFVNYLQLSSFKNPSRFPMQKKKRRLESNLMRYILQGSMATHSSTLAWKIPWMKEPCRLQSMGSLRVRHDWANSLSLFTFMHWRRKWQPTPVFLPGESQERVAQSDTTEAT